MTTRRANLLLQPVIDHCRNNRGAAAELRAILSKKIGVEVTDKSVRRWLHADADKRTEPLLGVAILLLEAAAEIGVPLPKNWRQP